MRTQSNPKEKTTNGQTPVTSGQNNGAALNGQTAADDHLAKANKAMKRAWTLISQRKGNQD